MVHRIAKRGNAYSVFAGNTEHQAEFVIFAAPTFWLPTSSTTSSLFTILSIPRG